MALHEKRMVSFLLLITHSSFLSFELSNLSNSTVLCRRPFPSNYDTAKVSDLLNKTNKQRQCKMHSENRSPRNTGGEN